MTKVNVTQSKLDGLAESIGAKAERRLPLTIDEMKDAVDGIRVYEEQKLQSKEVSPITTTQTIKPDKGYDGLSDVKVKAILPVRTSGDMYRSNNFVYAPQGWYASLAAFSMPNASISRYLSPGYQTQNGVLKWRVRPYTYVSSSGYIASGTVYGNYDEYNAVPSGTAITPSESSQTIGGSNYMMQGAVTVNPIPSQYIVPSGTKPITANGTGIDVTSYASVDVAVPVGEDVCLVTLTYDSNTDYWTPDKTFAEIADAHEAEKDIVVQTSGYNPDAAIEGVSCGWDIEHYRFTYTTDEVYYNGFGDYSDSVMVSYYYTYSSTGVTQGLPYLYPYPNNQDTSVTPTESSQTIEADTGYTGLGTVTVGAISSSYVGSGVTRRSSSDLTASGDTVSVPSGYYSSAASKAVSSGTEGTPTATKGTVSNHAISVTPSVTNSAGYISGGTHSGSAVSVSASELVSGTYTVSASGSHDVTNYASASVASGSRSASATKGTVSNHSVSVTPTATTTAGYLAAGSTNGTAVTVSASELVSGSQTITSNGTVDVTNLASVTVYVSGGGSSMNVATATATPSTASQTISFTGLSGEPTSFHVVCRGNLATASQVKVSAVSYDGTDHIGQTVTNTSNAQASYDDGFSHTYNNGTLTVTATTAYFQAEQYSLVYTYGGNSSNIGTADVQVGSGATSITFTELTEEPSCWSCIFKSDFGTSSGYTRTIAVVNDGNSIYGMEMGSGAQATSHWTASYSNGSLTISSQSTSSGGYFHQPGYYQLTYGIGGEVEPPTIEPLNVTQNGTYQESGKAYSPVTVNVSGGGSATVKSTTWTNSTNTTTSHTFSNLSGTPKAAFLRCTSSLSRSSSSTNYFIADMVWDGTSCNGNSFRRSNGTYANVTSGYSVTTGTNSITFTSSGTSTTNPGSYYNGTYELVYVY